jgi:Glucodextranase, domain B
VRKQLIGLLVLLLAGGAWGTSQIVQDRNGELFQARLSGNNLRLAAFDYQTNGFGEPRELYAFTETVSACALAAGDNGAFNLIFTLSGEVYFTASTSGGFNFSSPVRLAQLGQRPVLAAAGPLIAAAWEDPDGTIKYTSSGDRGLNWEPPVAVASSGETAAQPALAIDNALAPYLLYTSYNKKLNRYRLYFNTVPTGEAQLIFESQDEIINPKLAVFPQGLLAAWQTGYAGRLNTYYTASLDQGRHFGRVSAPAPDQPDLWFTGGKWQSLSPDQTSLKEMIFPPLSAPVLVRPSDGAKTNQASPEISYRTNASDPVTAKIEVSWDETFPPAQTWSFDNLTFFGTAETVFRLPLNLPDGNYFIRLSLGDGFSVSAPARTASLEIDSLPPVIALSAPTDEVSDDQQIVLSGQVSEPANLCLNGRSLSLEAGGTFHSSLALAAGKNLIDLLATDEAGNTARLTKTISYLTNVPHFTILKPKPSDWFKPGSALYFEAAVIPTLSGIADETEGEISAGGQTLADQPVYDAAGQKLSGFLALPAGLPDGPCPARVRLRDQAGNWGQKDFTINIDSSPPAFTVASSEPFFSGSSASIVLPLADSGSGLDLPGTLVSLNGVSLETMASGESGPVLRPLFPLPDGTYEVWVSARDRVGNTAEAATLRLIVDTVPPQLVVDNAATSQTGSPKLPVEGKAGDPYLSRINFYDNGKPAGSLGVENGSFSYAVPLSAGRNEIKVEAVDQAGNKTARSFSVQADLSTVGLIGKLAAGPSPYSPPRDGNLYFTFSFSTAPDEIKIYIFNLAGTLIWQRVLKNYADSSLAWDGNDLFGKRVSNGVYPYLAAVTGGGQTEIRRGKIIVLQ